MFKKIALTAMALGGLLAMSSVPAAARVRFGIAVVPPVYSYPAPYVNPYVYGYPYGYPGYYGYYTYPGYGYAPYGYGYGLGFYGGWGHHRGHDHDDHFERGGRAFRGGGFHGGGFHGGGHGRGHDRR